MSAVCHVLGVRLLRELQEVVSNIPDDWTTWAMKSSIQQAEYIMQIFDLLQTSESLPH